MSGKKKSKGPVVALVMLLIAGVIVAAVLVFDFDLGKNSYPLEYKELIAKYSDEYGLDPYYVCAVIRTESDFDPKAVSRAGARGLMQIMPDTGGWIAGKLSEESYNEDDLFDPDTNIRYGCWYLSFLNERFGGNMQLVAAAYNAGHNRVSDWLNDSNVSDGSELKDIPFSETEKYVKKIDKAYEKYKKYYQDEF